VPALADELSPQLVRQVAERDRCRPGRTLELAPLPGEIGVTGSLGHPLSHAQVRQMDAADVGGHAEEQDGLEPLQVVAGRLPRLAGIDIAAGHADQPFRGRSQRARQKSRWMGKT